MGKSPSSGYPAYVPGASAEGDAYIRRYPDVGEANMDPWYHYNTYGINEGRIWGPDENTESPMDAIMAMVESMMNSMTPDIAEPEPELTPEEQFALDQEKYIPKIDELYTERSDAASAATNTIMERIWQSESNARLLGTDYSVTDEEKEKMISEEFATMWDWDRENQLTGWMDEWEYQPEGFEGFTVHLPDTPVGSVSGEHVFNDDSSVVGPPENVITSPGGVPILTDEENDEENFILG